MASEKKKNTKPQDKKQKPALKAKIKKRILPKQKKEEEYAQRDLEDVLIYTLLSTKTELHPQPRLFMQSVVYNATESMRQLAYNYGFSVGKGIYERASNGGIAPLLEILESAGMGRMLYMPVGDAAIIKSSTRASQAVNAKNNLHPYEAGIISGYLSAHSSNTIITVETHCMYNGAPFCQFVSGQRGERPMPAQSSFTIDQTLYNIISAIDHSTDPIRGKAQIYLLLSMLPIIKEPLLTESSKLMFLAGKRFSEQSRSEDAEKSLRKLANFFDLEDIKTGKEKNGMTATLRYGPHNSMQGFMELSTKAFIGFLSKRFNSPVRLRAGRHGKNYTMALSVTGGA